MRKHIGSRIRQARKECSITLDMLSHALGITPYQLSKYERGKDRVTAEKLYDISILLNKPIEWFFLLDNLVKF